MELKQIKELMAAMGRTGTKKLSLEQGDFKLKLEREGDEKVIIEPSPSYASHHFAHETELLSRAEHAFAKGANASTLPPAAHKNSSPTQQQENEERAFSDQGEEESSGKLQYVKSPMVGTFYIAPSPEEPPFTKIGQQIEPNSVVCIVEAMKVMNEIKAGMAGVVEEILVENGHPIEFGTPLFKIKVG